MPQTPRTPREVLEEKSLMIARAVKLTVVLLAAALPLTAQVTVSDQGVRQPTEAQIANYKRLEELWRHPTFVTLRLTSMARDFPREDPTTTPRPYTTDEWLHFELFITQNSTETLTVSRSPLYSAQLIRDGDIIDYSKSAQERVEQEKRAKYGSASAQTLAPGRESRFGPVFLEDWYESPFLPGHYQLIVRKQFTPDGDWVESNPVTFDIIPRKTPAPIPKDVSIRLVPERVTPAKNESYHLTTNDSISNIVVNNSEEQVTITVIDAIYGNRPELFRDGKPIPYLKEVAKQIQSKESDPRLV